MAKPLTDAEVTRIKRFIIDNNLIGSKLRPLQDAVLQATGIKVSIISGKLTQLKNEAAAEIQTATEATAAQMRIKEIKALDESVDTVKLIENLGELCKDTWEALTDPMYAGPIPKWTNMREYIALLDRYNTLVANLAQFHPPPPPKPDESQIDPRFLSRYVVDMDAEIEIEREALMQRWLFKERVATGGMKRPANKLLNAPADETQNQ